MNTIFANLYAILHNTAIIVLAALNEVYKRRVQVKKLYKYLPSEDHFKLEMNADEEKMGAE